MESRLPHWFLGVALVLGAHAPLADSDEAVQQSPTAGQDGHDRAVAMTPFTGNPCQLAQGSPYEAVELAAFDQWHGAWTTPVGDRQALVFGVSADPVASVDQPDVDAEAQAVSRAAGSGIGPEQRQRLFALGLAVLLNLNSNR